MAVALYDLFSDDYDRFVDWHSRLAYELAFLEGQLSRVGARSVLDVACGTGMHAIALAERGYHVIGVDLSPRMIEKAKTNAAMANLDIPFSTAGFGKLRRQIEGNFDALLCLGNSLPHVLESETLDATLVDFAAMLDPGGLLLIQNRNFDPIVARRERWMAPQTHQDGDQEWIFIRFYDYSSDGTITFNVIKLHRHGREPWTQTTDATQLRPILHDELIGKVTRAGFGSLTCYSSMSGDPYQAAGSNLIIAALKDSSQAKGASPGCSAL